MENRAVHTVRNMSAGDGIKGRREAGRGTAPMERDVEKNAGSYAEKYRNTPCISRRGNGKI